MFSAISAPKSDFKNILETFEDGLAQEQDVTRRFYNLSELANKDKDYATISFLNWFLDEQVEEESMFETHIDYLKRIGDDSNTLYLYEKNLQHVHLMKNKVHNSVYIFKLKFNRSITAHPFTFKNGFLYFITAIDYASCAMNISI